MGKRKPAATAPKARSKPAPEPGTCRTASDLARLLGVATRTVETWIRAGAPRRDDKSFVVADVLRWREARAAERSKPKNGSALANAERDFRVTRTKIQALKLGELEGRLLDRESVERGRVARIMAVKGRLLALPRQAGTALVGKDAREIEAWLREWAVSSLRAFSENGSR